MLGVYLAYVFSIVLLSVLVVVYSPVSALPSGCGFHMIHISIGKGIFISMNRSLHIATGASVGVRASTVSNTAVLGLHLRVL